MSIYNLQFIRTMFNTCPYCDAKARRYLDHGREYLCGTFIMWRASR